MRLFLSFLIYSLLAGCSLLPSSPPSVLKISAMSQGDVKRIFWVDEVLKQPEKLTELAILGDYGQYQAEYRWREGYIREIERAGSSLLDGKKKNYSLLIRYDETGQAIYQKYLVNGEIFPLKQAQLTSYFQEANQAYENAKLLNKKNKHFFQGYVQKNRIINCAKDKERLLTINDPHLAKLALDDKKYFIAAVGRMNLVRSTVETIIAFESENTACFTRPVFEQNE